MIRLKLSIRIFDFYQKILYYIDMLKKFLKNHHSWVLFAGVFLGIFIITFSVLYVAGFMPSEFEAAKENPTLVAELQEDTFKGLGLEPTGTIQLAGNQNVEIPKAPLQNSVKAEKAIRLEATSIGLNASIQNPANTNYSTLNNALAKGAVYYPGSGTVQAGNMFIFGHSTSYKVVNNPAYKIFNNVKNLKEGDEVKVYTVSKVYVYKVDNVKLVDSREAVIQFSNNQRMLTLSTCNSFGQPSDRYVVEAIFDHELDI
jgi:LPXTG-site transpeptidase (sortase) family protein